MNDIYELLNNVDIDENEIETMQVSDIEKANVKKYLKKSLKKNKGWKKKGLVVAALCCVVIGSVGAVGITNPAYAAEIPIVGDIFRFLDNGRTGVYEKYKDYAEVIGLTQESNGVSITIKEAIFDGRTLSYTYEIKTDKDLGEAPFLSVGGPTLNIKNYNGGTSGSSGTKKIDDNTYVGQDNMTMNEERKDISFELNFTNIGDMSSMGSKEIKGNWDFKINLKALENKKQLVNKGTEKDGVKANIDSISKTPISFIITYSQIVPKGLKGKWFDMNLDIEAKDDLGNIYEGQGDGGYGDDKGNMTLSKTFGKLDKNATKLMITPKMYLSNTGGGVKLDENGDEIKIRPIIDINNREKREILLDDIVIDLEK